MFFLGSLLQSKLQPTLITFNAALSAFDSTGLWMEALGVLVQLQDHCLLPDLITFHALLACNKTEWRRACMWLTEVDGRYLQRDLVTQSAIITACTAAEQWELSLFLGSGDAHRASGAGDAHTVTDTIVACDRGGMWESTLWLLESMADVAVEGDTIACNAAMAACASQGAWSQVLFGLRELQLKELSALAYDAAVVACANAEKASFSEDGPSRPDDAGSDEEDPELYEQLSKQRRLVKRADTGQAKKGEAALTQVSERIQGMAGEEDEEKEQKEKELSNVALTATTEFCNVVQTPLEKIETLKHESFRGSTLYKQQATQRKGIAAGERKARKAGLPEEVLAATKDAEEDLEQTLIEESLDLSCASGLEYLRARSQIGCDQDSHRIRKLDNRPLEMSTVDGDIKLEYRDDFGRVQTPKEAFRSISWKFHGKVPGRKNMERRLLRLENEMRLKSMNVIEALPTLRALRHAQTAEAKPYMVLSGANEK
ncbi:DOT2 [Symbiodinium natans]|uniref:DOT2 protein n=1 Tax=Symbiodinium natans TaxID=878477 RepID=A0A812T9X4_9DINO|nr:DOT2 [Symbiodinium natans]